MYLCSSSWLIGRASQQPLLAFAVITDKADHPVDKLRRWLAAGQPGPLHLQEPLGHQRIVLRNRVDRHRQDKGNRLRNKFGALHGEFPLKAEVTLVTRLGLGRNYRQEEGAIANVA